MTDQPKKFARRGHVGTISERSVVKHRPLIMGGSSLEHNRVVEAVSTEQTVNLTLSSNVTDTGSLVFRHKNSFIKLLTNYDNS